MLRNRFFSTFLTLGLLAAASAAQVQPIPNTGCPNAAYPTTTGQPAIGQGFGIIAAACASVTGQPFIAIGVPGLSAVLPMPPACAQRCVVECRPIVVLLQSAFRILIPNDRNLVGATLCFQTGCVEGRQPPCIDLHGALGVRITP